MARKKPIIGLAGGIGAGKSTVAKVLSDLGCIVAHSDRDGRAALKDPVIVETLVAWWGEGILDEQGEVDRSAVASIVFSNPAERKRLESLTHPWIEARRRSLFRSSPPDAPALVIDAPLLFEAGLVSECDAVIFVETPRERRLDRLRASRGWDESELQRREDSQEPLDAKRSRADYVVRNDSDLSDLVARVRTILREIVESRLT